MPIWAFFVRAIMKPNQHLKKGNANMSEKEYVVVDGVRYVKGTEPLSWEEKLKRMNARTTDMPATAIKTKSKRSRKQLDAEN